MDIKQSLKDNLRAWAEFDAARPSAPGEHLLVAGAGLLLLASALRTGCRTTAALQAMAAGALLVRAASGRDGLCSLLTQPAAGEPGAPAPVVERSF